MDWNKKFEEEGHYHEWNYKALNGCQFKCFIRRNGSSFNWCGYVEVDSDNRWYANDYFDVPIDCHGGLTYAKTEKGITTYGFDCAHFNDMIFVSVGQGGGVKPHKTSGAIYRDKEYVIEECQKMAEQFSKSSRSAERKEVIEIIFKEK
jgi:hypothetical protein